MSGLSEEELRALHGEDYVARFKTNQDNFRLERLLPYLQLKKTDRIADFACGNAMLMPLIAPLVASYDGVDFSSDFIAAATEHAVAENIDNATFHCEDINQFCKNRPKQFDAGFAMDFSEHVYDEDWLQILSAIRNSLKPGAWFYLHTPNASYLIEQLKSAGILRQLPEHIAVRDDHANVRLLETAGFNEISVTFLPHYEKRQAWVHHFHHIPLLGKLFRARLFIMCKA